MVVSRASVQKTASASLAVVKMTKITAKTKLSKILEKKPESAMILIKAGMGCVGCPMAMQETLEQGCLAHGLTKKQIDRLVEELNK